MCNTLTYRSKTLVKADECAIQQHTLPGPIRWTLHGLYPLVTKVLPLVDQAIWDAGILTPQFYFTFWQLSLGDIEVPEEAYRDAISSQNRSGSAERSGPRSADSVSRLRRQLDDLKGELLARQQRRTAVMQRLSAESKHWFPKPEVTTLIHQHCIAPRVSVSRADAVYCARFLDCLHKLGTDAYWTIGMINQVCGVHTRAAHRSTHRRP